MKNIIIEKMQERTRVDLDDSDASFFTCNLLFLEMILKMTCSFFVASLEESKNKSKHNIVCKLVRADGLGEWVSALDNIVNGPSFSNIIENIKPLCREITQKQADSWQAQVYKTLCEAALILEVECDSANKKYSLMDAFRLCVVMRNKTKAHGAPTIDKQSKASSLLSDSAIRIYENLFIFNYEWCYLKQNLSKKYRVTKISEHTNSFDPLKTQVTQVVYSEGIYVYIDRPRKVELIISNENIKDFYFVNGSFGNSKFECLSYVTGEKNKVDSAPYKTPCEDVQRSTTCGLDILEVQNNFFGNMPPRPSGYISRHENEEELLSIIRDERNPMITLVGPGGIGKTSLLLNVLHNYSKSESDTRTVIWFSARDIDLFDTGPKIVRAEALDQKEIADLFFKVTNLTTQLNSQTNSIEYFSKILAFTEIQEKYIFVFDNFETLRHPVETFNWINTNIRLPNKAIITTRFRNFRGDYPITLQGMTEIESCQLIDSHTKTITHAGGASSEVKQRVYAESEGHPYVIKVLVASILRDNSFSVKNILYRREDILDALFERTYNMLTEPAKRIYLTLGLWKSAVPELAVHAVFSLNYKDFSNVEGAIQELVDFSFIERLRHDEEINSYLNVPKASYLFAQEKIKSSQFKYDAQEDAALLKKFGPANANLDDIKNKIVLFVKNCKSEKSSYATVEKMNSILKYICGDNPDLYQIAAGALLYCFPQESISFFKKFIEKSSESEAVADAWLEIYNINRNINSIYDHEEMLHALIQSGIIYINYDLNKASDIANTINSYIFQFALPSYTGQLSIMINRFASELEENIHQMVDDDDIFSRCAWLYLHAGNKDKCRVLAERGIAKNPGNDHCQRLKERLDQSGQW